MPTPDLRTSNQAESSTLAGMETDESEAYPNTGEEVSPHFATSRKNKPHSSLAEDAAMVAVFFEGELEEYYSPTQRQCKG